MLRLTLVDTDAYKFCVSFENNIYTVKVSQEYQYWFYAVFDLISFFTTDEVEIEIPPDTLDYARSLYIGHSYDERVLREYEPPVLVHSTTKENLCGILKDGSIKSWNVLKQENSYFENIPIGALLGDIPDFSNYVMLSDFKENNEIVILSKQKKCILSDINQQYCAGARFYLNAKKLAEDGLLVRDGIHLKVFGKIDLGNYLICYTTPEILEINEITTPKLFFQRSNAYFKRLYREYL